MAGDLASPGTVEQTCVDLRPGRGTVSELKRCVCDGILEVVGDTPLVRLRRYAPAARFQLFAKLEALNPAGSIKDRPATLILEHALRSGALRPGAVVIESSSGNMGIGLAQACRYHGLRFICVVDPKTTETNLGVLRAYGAEIDHYNEAFASLQEALKLNPNDYAAMYQFGRTGALSGKNLDQAEEYLKRYLTYRPGVGEAPVAGAHFRLGQVYEKKGNRLLARKHYEEALKLDPKLEDAREALAKLQ